MSKFQTDDIGDQSRLVEKMMDEFHAVMQKYDNLVLVSTVVGCLEIFKATLIAGQTDDAE